MLGNPEMIAAMTAEWITEDAIDPDWSIHRITVQGNRRRAREKNRMRSVTMTRRCAS